MSVYLCAFLLGGVAGLRTMMVPAAVAWAARLGALHLKGTPFSLLGNVTVAWVFTAFALAELVADQLPTTPSRKVPLQFATRVVIGGLAGCVICYETGSVLLGVIAGVAGAVVGTLAGSAARERLASTFGRDRPAALLEDVVALGAAVLLMAAL